MKIWAKTTGAVSEGKFLVVRRDGSVPGDVARRNLEYRLNPDVEEVIEYNRQANDATCPHARRTYVVHEFTEHWTCRDCRARHVGAPPKGEGVHSAHGFEWRAA